MPVTQTWLDDTHIQMEFILESGRIINTKTVEVIRLPSTNAVAMVYTQIRRNEITLVTQGVYWSGWPDSYEDRQFDVLEKLPHLWGGEIPGDIPINVHIPYWALEAFMRNEPPQP